MIDVVHVSRSYRRSADEVHALDDVSVHVGTGRFVAFMGP
jgi:ABC-type lipoprotein export system ATPase subunit